MSDDKLKTSEVSTRPFGILAEYKEPDELIAAAKQVRAEGYERWDSYSPFPVHGIDPAMGIKPTKLPYFVIVAGLTGCSVGLGLQWWTNGLDYPWIVSGKPFFSVPANIPITFELTILFSALTTFLTMLILNGLPKPSSPLDRVRRFARATDDRFFIVIETDDPKYDEEQTRSLLSKTSPLAMELVPADTSSDKLPKELLYGVLVVASVALVPFGIIASARASTTQDQPWHLVPNMDYQLKYKAQKKSDFFADGRTSRPEVDGTVAIGELRVDEHFFDGKVNGTWALALPDSVTANEATMARGEERFGIYCAPCHADSGNGNGMVHQRAFALKEGTWVKPTNLADAKIAQKPIGELFNTISHGIRNMPGYAKQIATADRWAIALYLRALQYSQAEYAAQAVPADEAQAVQADDTAPPAEGTSAAPTEPAPSASAAPTASAGPAGTGTSTGETAPAGYLEKK